ncbi:MAG: DUF2019 domain-containing protein [Verrucomicrobiae bacterium]|nr:DUF2019 domain-containing protein [Verrucomicrobiae bacterium]
MKVETKNADVGMLLKLYVEAAVAHYCATEKGDYRTANRQHDVVAAAYRELRGRGIEAQRSLLVLLDHPNEAVRAWAAAHALEFAPDEGEPILQSIAKGSGVCKLNATITLDEWKKGALKFP